MKEDLTQKFEEVDSDYEDLRHELSRLGDDEGDVDRIENVIDSMHAQMEELRYIIKH